MEPQRFSVKAFCAIFIFSGIVAHAGEKIQFSSPSQREALPSEKSSISKPAPNLFDKYRGGGAEALNIPLHTPPPSRSQEKSKGDRDNWILAKPDDGSPEEEQGIIDPRMRPESNRATGLERYVQEFEKSRDLQQQEQRQKLAIRDSEKDSEEEKGVRPSSKEGSVFNNSTSSFDTDRLNRETFTFKDYWKEMTGSESSRFDDQNALRRSEFQQIFETRTTVDQFSAVDKKADPSRIAPAPTDFGGRTSQGSQRDYENLQANGTRSTLFQNMNERALGRDSSSALNIRPEPPKVKAQPAILPFPARPGELFKRPGSF